MLFECFRAPTYPCVFADFATLTHLASVRRSTCEARGVVLFSSYAMYAHPAHVFCDSVSLPNLKFFYRDDFHTPLAGTVGRSVVTRAP